MSGQDQSGQSRGHSRGASLAHPDLVHSLITDVDSTASAVVMDATNGTLDTPITQESSQHERETKIDGMSLVRRQYKNKGLSDHVTGILLDSWRPSTQKQYAVHFKRWHVFCRERKITPYSPALTDVLDFLYTQLRLSYSSLNTARSALSCIISIDNVPVGKHPLVCRFLKGAFENKPPSNKHYAIWDVRTVLEFLKTFTPNSSLTLKDMSLKLTMLLALVTIQRKQTLTQLKINDNCMIKSDTQFLFHLDTHVKQSRPNYTVPPVIVPRYSVDLDICPYSCLEEYLARTQSIRHGDNLLISFIKPHHGVGGQTVARWIKLVFVGAGIDIALFKPHSTRHAASTAAYVADIPIDEILKRAGWSNASTFKQFYYRRVIT